MTEIFINALLQRVLLDNRSQQSVINYLLNHNIYINKLFGNREELKKEKGHKEKRHALLEKGIPLLCKKYSIINDVD